MHEWKREYPMRALMQNIQSIISSGLMRKLIRNRACKFLLGEQISGKLGFTPKFLNFSHQFSWNLCLKKGTFMLSSFLIYSYLGASHGISDFYSSNNHYWFKISQVMLVIYIMLLIKATTGDLWSSSSPSW